MILAILNGLCLLTFVFMAYYRESSYPSTILPLEISTYVFATVCVHFVWTSVIKRTLIKPITNTLFLVKVVYIDGLRQTFMCNLYDALAWVWTEWVLLTDGNCMLAKLIFGVISKVRRQTHFWKQLEIKSVFNILNKYIELGKKETKYVLNESSSHQIISILLEHRHILVLLSKISMILPIHQTIHPS